jgi:hypothetical protein
MDIFYEIGEEYCFNEIWNISLAKIKESADSELVKSKKCIMFHAYTQYEFQGDTQDHVSLAFYLPIELLGFSPREWELDDNYILPFESIDEKHPNNPDGAHVSLRQAESEPYYDIKLNIDEFPYCESREDLLPYVLITDIRRLRVLNESIIWLELSYCSPVNKGHPDNKDLGFEGLPIEKTVRHISIPLTDEYVKKVLHSAQQIEYEIRDRMMTNTTFDSIVSEHISASFKLIAIAKHIYMEQANNLRFTEDVDSNRNLEGQIDIATEVYRFYPKKELIFPVLMEMKNPTCETHVDKATEYYGLFKYMSNNRVRSGGDYEVPRECYIKLPLLLMKNIEDENKAKEYSHE